MGETSKNLVTRLEFRLVAFGLAALIIAGGLFQRRLQESSSYALPRPPKNTPIVVRGGAMTAFTTVAGGWLGPSHSVYCLDVNDISSVIISNDSIEPATIWSSSTLQLPTITPWQVDIYGHDPRDKTGQTKRDGWRFASQVTGCPHAGSSPGSGPSITLTAFDNGGFYHDQAPYIKPRTGGYDFLATKTPVVRDRTMIETMKICANVLRI